jgi:hypothetical protein
MEKESLSATKDLSEIAKPFVEPIIASLLAPKLKQISAFLDSQRKTNIVSDKIKIEGLFKEYLISAYKTFCTMNVLVFPNKQIMIHDIYQPLTLESSSYKLFKIIKFDKKHLDKFGRILISDTGGMGKSTLMKWIGASIIEQKLAIPILIELKKISRKNKIINDICSQLGDAVNDFDKNLFLQLIDKGEFVFLLDGFDEIKDELKSDVIKDIKSFIRKSSKNYFIITSRPESSLASFGEFQRFNISPLSVEESFELINKYDTQNVNKIASRLISDIQDRLTQVEEFLINPFLVSLLYRTYTYNKDIPVKKTTFYDDVYSALYKNHDLTKDGFKRDKLSGLDIEDFRTVLSLLAFDTAKAVEVEYTEQKLLSYLEGVRQKRIELKFRSSSFVEDIELTVPLFTRDGNILKWAHKSLQDFFAASYVNTSPIKRVIIEAIYDLQKSNYLNILEFLFEMEHKIMLEVIIYDIAKAFVNFCDTSYQEIPGVNDELIRKRQEVSFDVKHAFSYTEDLEVFGQGIEGKLEKALNTTRDIEYFGYEYGTKNTFNHSSTHAASSSFRIEILAALYKKDVSIVRPSNRSTGAIHHAEKFITSLAFGKIYIVDDNPKNPLNSPERFDHVTNFLHARNHRIVGNLLDYDKCYDFVKLINSNKNVIADNDDLTGL